MGWIGVDLDGTLAEYHGWGGAEEVGDPVGPMVSRVLGWLNSGKEVRILTARAGSPELLPAVKLWCLKHLGREVPITDKKDFGMELLYDDRARQVVFNKGIVVGE